MNYKSLRSKLGIKRPKSKIIIKLKKMSDRLRARRKRNLMTKTNENREQDLPV